MLGGAGTVALSGGEAGKGTPVTGTGRSTLGGDAGLDWAYAGMGVFF